MIITKTATYSISFSVMYYEGSDGGMDSDTFMQKKVPTLEEAIHLWELANASSPNHEWTIVVNINAQIGVKPPDRKKAK